LIAKYTLAAYASLNVTKQLAVARNASG